jgi:CMP-N,N'-diacetyllegionaminic acid synthase
MIALIGARAGSKRLPGKNIKLLGGRPLVVWTLQAAFDAECFERVVLSTDSQEIASAALDWCGKALEVIIRPEHLAEDTSTDLEWINHALIVSEYRHGPALKEFSILRPTSPFRDHQTIQRARALWDDIKSPCPEKRGVGICDLCDCAIPHARPEFTSLRSMRPVTEHPWKMWRWNDPLVDYQVVPFVRREAEAGEERLHSLPTQSLTSAYIQTGGLEMGWTRNIAEGSISGNRVAGFILEGPEGVDINSPEDWAKAEALADELTRVSLGA